MQGTAHLSPSVFEQEKDVTEGLDVYLYCVQNNDYDCIYNLK